MRPFARAIPTCCSTAARRRWRPSRRGGGLDLMIGSRPACRRRPAKPRAGRPAAVGDAGPGEAAGPDLSARRAGDERPGALLLALADDHDRPRGRRERPVAVRGRRGQLRAVDPAGRAGSEAGSLARRSAPTWASSAATASKRCTASIGATRPPASPATCPARPCLPPASGAVGSFKRNDGGGCGQVGRRPAAVAGLRPSHAANRRSPGE